MLQHALAHDGRTDGAGGGVDGNVGALGELLRTKQELGLAAAHLNLHNNTLLHHAVRLRGLTNNGVGQQHLKLVDASFDEPLLLFGGVVSAVLLEVALFTRLGNTTSDVVTGNRK